MERSQSTLDRQQFQSKQFMLPARGRHFFVCNEGQKCIMYVFVASTLMCFVAGSHATGKTTCIYTTILGLAGSTVYPYYILAAILTPPAHSRCLPSSINCGYIHVYNRYWSAGVFLRYHRYGGRDKKKTDTQFNTSYAEGRSHGIR